MIFHVVDVIDVEDSDLVSDQSIYFDEDGHEFLLEGCRYCDYRETCLEIGECIA